MFFRLKNDYVTREGESHRDFWKVMKIKKGALIAVRIFFELNFEVETEFMFGAERLHYLDLSMLELPDYCIKDFGGDVFCATHQKFFHGSYNHSPLTVQLVCCPLCGQKLKEEDTFSLKKEYLDIWDKYRKKGDNQK